MLKTRSHRNKAIQADWNEDGADKFVFEIVGDVQITDDPNFSPSNELTLLEMIWLENLQPFGEKGYSPNDQIRQV
jgi:hypothetical protein